MGIVVQEWQTTHDRTGKQHTLLSTNLLPPGEFISVGYILN
jgi:hypothetical protein